MGFTEQGNTINGNYPSGSRNVITIGDGVTSFGMLNAQAGVLNTVFPQATDILSPNGGLIKLLPGNYSLNGDLALFSSPKHNVTIEGSGASTKVVTYNSSCQYTIKAYANTSSVSNLNIQKIRFVTNAGPALWLGGTQSIKKSIISNNIFEYDIGGGMAMRTNTNPGHTLDTDLGMPNPTYLFPFDEDIVVSNTILNAVTNTSITVTKQNVGFGFDPLTVPMGYSGEHFFTFGSNSHLHASSLVFLPSSDYNAASTFDLSKTLIYESLIYLSNINIAPNTFKGILSQHVYNIGTTNVYLSFGVFYTNNNEARFAWGFSSGSNFRVLYTNSRIYAPSQWHHVIFVIKPQAGIELSGGSYTNHSSATRLYINGQLVASGNGGFGGYPTTGSITATSEANNMGTYWGNVGGFTNTSQECFQSHTTLYNLNTTLSDLVLDNIARIRYAQQAGSGDIVRYNTENVLADVNISTTKYSEL